MGISYTLSVRSFVTNQTKSLRSVNILIINCPIRALPAESYTISQHTLLAGISILASSILSLLLMAKARGDCTTAERTLFILKLNCVPSSDKITRSFLSHLMAYLDRFLLERFWNEMPFTPHPQKVSDPQGLWLQSFCLQGGRNIRYFVTSTWSEQPNSTIFIGWSAWMLHASPKLLFLFIDGKALIKRRRPKQAGGGRVGWMTYLWEKSV